MTSVGYAVPPGGCNDLHQELLFWDDHSLACRLHLLFHGTFFSTVIWYFGEHQMSAQLHSGEPLPVVAQWHGLYPQVINVAYHSGDHSDNDHFDHFQRKHKL
jgi:hypothetical protein